MKQHGILNSPISQVLSTMGHTDQLTIADCGLPIHDESQRIDLSLTIGTPSFIDVLEAVAADMAIEKVIIASEIRTHNPKLLTYLKDQFSELEIEFVDHETFKKLTHHSKAVIRTGEATPYANIILQSGVIF
ncbi:D-ribose pyranase [Dolosicoccus paucivorans]|uniref:D-ribose pyranase n=1 Tax=Dolosicoccus paucivorans TaxID=84521 RepID=UPI00087E3D2B|nr:D-ribose pyranase [Dolosicoccus paucivorans]PMB85065.1 D-ribose pyranase [Dolosicoccus paucivorans]SDI67988.1 ribose transport protein RbsD [Dolosicoccus paucivorans]